MDENPSLIGDLINFEKMAMIGILLREIRKYQHTPYTFEVTIMKSFYGIMHNLLDTDWAKDSFLFDQRLDSA